MNKVYNAKFMWEQETSRMSHIYKKAWNRKISRKQLFKSVLGRRGCYRKLT